MTLLFWHNAYDDLPKDDSPKIVITLAKSGNVSWNRAYWDGLCWHGSGSMSNVRFWADVADKNDMETLFMYLNKKLKGD